MLIRDKFDRFLSALIPLCFPLAGRLVSVNLIISF